MTPKEKAQELDSRFYELVADTFDPDWRAKQGALIAVDEIIEIARDAYDEEMLAAVIIYWSKVKQELENK